MRRREFVRTTLTALPALAFADTIVASAPTAHAFVVKAGASRFGVPTPFRGVSPNDLKLSSKDTGGVVSAFDFVGLDRRGPSLHVHPGQDEAFYVVSGEYVFLAGEEKQRLAAGDVIFLPRGIKHCWVQVSDRGQLFYFLQPAGQMEEYFLKITQLGESPDPAALAKVRAESGITTLGPGLNATDPHVLSETLTHGFLVRAGRGRFAEAARSADGSAHHVKVSGRDTGSALAIFEVTGRQKSAQPLHVHAGQDEVAYVVSGGYRVRCGGETFTLAAGDMVFLPRAVPHACAQVTDQGTMLSYFTPSGRIEDFFVALAEQPSRAAADVATLYTRHGLTLVGPPPAA